MRRVERYRDEHGGQEDQDHPDSHDRTGLDDVAEGADQEAGAEQDEEERGVDPEVAGLARALIRVQEVGDDEPEGGHAGRKYPSAGERRVPVDRGGSERTREGRLP